MHSDFLHTRSSPSPPPPLPLLCPTLYSALLSDIHHTNASVVLKGRQQGSGQYAFSAPLCAGVQSRHLKLYNHAESESQPPIPSLPSFPILHPSFLASPLAPVQHGHCKELQAYLRSESPRRGGSPRRGDGWQRLRSPRQSRAKRRRFGWISIENKISITTTTQNVPSPPPREHR